MKLYNTLSRKIEKFVPRNKNVVKIYTCGPTVYHYAHIGNLRTYIMEDILEKSLNYLGYKVDRVMNITDVGHLTSDSDSGDDKMLKGAKRENKTVLEIAEMYTKAFMEDTDKLNIKWPDTVSKATDNIDEYIKIITKLLDEGLYPYTKRYLGTFNNHFSTIGLVGMNEACLNAKWIKEDLTNEDKIWDEIILYAKGRRVMQDFFVGSDLMPEELSKVYDFVTNISEETLENVLPWSGASKTLSPNLYLSTRCYPFEKNPYISNLFGSNTSNESNFRNIVDVAGNNNLNSVRPYLKIQNKA